MIYELRVHDTGGTLRVAGTSTPLGIPATGALKDLFVLLGASSEGEWLILDEPLHLVDRLCFRCNGLLPGRVSK